MRRTVAPVESGVGVGGVAEGAGLAHDAGNLLGALTLYSDLLALPGVLHEEHRGYAQELKLLSERSWAMIDRLVNHARAARSAGAEAEKTVVPEVVNRCRGLLSKVAGRTVEVSYGAGAFEPVRVPAESVERILANLVKNAAEATPWVGAITVSVERVAERTDDGLRQRIVMTVRDGGCGMDAATVRGLMQVGGISQSGRRGLGFRVVRELVAMSGGCLNIESQLDVGTSISVEWYVAKNHEDQEVSTVMQGEAGSRAC
jgi:signal transduction histidine kinase